MGRSKCNPKPIGTLEQLERPSAASGTMPPTLLAASNFFNASTAAPAARGVIGRDTATARGVIGRDTAADRAAGVPESRDTREEDNPPAPWSPPRLEGRLLGAIARSEGAAEDGAGGDPSSLRREIPSERLGELKENKDEEIEKLAATAAAPHSLSRASRSLHSGAYSAPQIPGRNR
jgi:hypothetical protein